MLLIRLLLAGGALPQAGTPFDLLAWFGDTVPAGALINGLGLGALAILFATDRIKTRGQADRELARQQEMNDKLTKQMEASHTAAIAELVKHHNELSVEKDKRYSELEQSRDYYRDARLEERDRADKATDAVAEALELARAGAHVLQSLDEAAREVKP